VRALGVERSATVVVEVENLFKAGFIRECQYPEWVLNVVLVKKPIGHGECASTLLT